MQDSSPEPGATIALGRDARRQSELLHERVQRFVSRSTAPPLVASDDADDFDTLALDIARFQLAQCPGFERLCERGRVRFDDVDAIPAVPVDAFRMTRVAAHPEELDATVFRTSGTTSQEPGHHPVRSLATYDLLALELARRTLFAPRQQGIVVALAPEPGETPTSSLGYMMRLFMEHFDGRALVRSPAGAPFSALAPERWLVQHGQVDLDGLTRACAIARERSEPLFVLATAFALAGCVEQLESTQLATPRETYVMVTGGFKGLRTSLDADSLRTEVARAFDTPSDRLLGEYGMTELTSQLYEAWPPGVLLSTDSSVPSTPSHALRPSWCPATGRPGLFHAPPWLRATAIDPVSGDRVAPGEVGVARFVDLGNVDSAIAIVTADLVREVDGGIELLGRRPSSTPRGCSLPFEGLLSSSSPRPRMASHRRML